MKLVVMKSICLLALLAGVFMLGLVFDVGQAQLVHERALEYWPRQETGGLNLRLPGTVVGILLALGGLYGFAPKLPGRKNDIIAYKSEHGDIELQLRPVRKTLLKMVRKMPEVYSIKLSVTPDADGRRARIEADVVLKNCAALGARKCSMLVAEYLAASARNVLGLNDLSMVRVNVRGVHIDVSATSKQVREQLVLREETEAEAYALAHSPIAAVTLDGETTENSGAVGDAQGHEVAEEAVCATEEQATTEATTDNAAPATAEAASETSETSEENAPEAEAEDEAVEMEAPEETPPTQDEDEEVAQHADTPVAAEAALDEEEARQLESDINLPPLTDHDEPMPPAPQVNLDGESAEDESSGLSDGLSGETPDDMPEAESIDETQALGLDDADVEPEAEPADDTQPIEDDPPESRWT